MKTMRMLAVAAVVVVIGATAAVADPPPAKPAPQPEPVRPTRAYVSGPFARLRDLTYEQRVQLMALWAQVRTRMQAAEADEEKARKAYDERSLAVLTKEQKEELKAFQAKREADRKALMERVRVAKPEARPAAKPTPGPALDWRVRGPLRALTDLSPEQVEKINAAVKAREEARARIYAKVREDLAAQENEFQANVDRVLTRGQKARIKALEEEKKTEAERVAAERAAAEKKRIEEARKRYFHGDVRYLKSLTDAQKTRLGSLYQQLQDAAAAAQKAEKAAYDEYLKKGKALLNQEQLKALEELEKRTRIPQTRGST